MNKILKIFFCVLLFSCALNAQEIPAELLGGMLKSDSWVIKRDLQQEIFTGNVRFDSGMYKLNADKVISNRKNNTVSIIGNAYLFNRLKTGETIELFSDKILFNTKNRKGSASKVQNPVNIIYQMPEEYKLDILSNYAHIDGIKSTINLKEDVKIKYTTPASFILGYADSAFIDRANRNAVFEGSVEFDNTEYTLYAGKVSYEGSKNEITIERNYPLILAANEDITGALQSDFIKINTLTKKVHARGRVSGWVAPSN
ncbi:hypothetical protein Emin_0589 [Elusimicrobium minutum Pei191]|uniref:Organic solvent tolerance-like N-terminal domain-containing protein n=1 Tax=Elusimicrobium minutum (strain Pei191) TaxID=445932 RepID=B2KC17_ELUMP|nr:LptA/OstA family protein [Elusimicrobium minutum]ACC98144.1 hypothetical protein Emin_0589 [Elusimicrobium minutum Pei191]